MQSKITGLKGSIQENVPKALQGPWTIICDKCGIIISDVWLSVEGIEDLIKANRRRYNATIQIA